MSLWPKDLSEDDVKRVLRELTGEYGGEQEWERAAFVDIPKQLRTADAKDHFEEIYLTLVCNHSRPDATVFVQIRVDGVRLFAKYTGHRLARYYRAPALFVEGSHHRREYAAEVKAAYETWRCRAKRKLFA